MHEIWEAFPRNQLWRLWTRILTHTGSLSRTHFRNSLTVVGLLVVENILCNIFKYHFTNDCFIGVFWGWSPSDRWSHTSTPSMVFNSAVSDSTPTGPFPPTEGLLSGTHWCWGRGAHTVFLHHFNIFSQNTPSKCYTNNVWLIKMLPHMGKTQEINLCILLYSDIRQYKQVLRAPCLPGMSQKWEKKFPSIESVKSNEIRSPEHSL